MKTEWMNEFRGSACTPIWRATMAVWNSMAEIPLPLGLRAERNVGNATSIEINTRRVVERTAEAMR